MEQKIKPMAIENFKVENVYKKNTTFYTKEVKINTGNGEIHNFTANFESRNPHENPHFGKELLVVTLDNFETESAYKVSIEVELKKVLLGEEVPVVHIWRTKPREVHKNSLGLRYGSKFLGEIHEDDFEAYAGYARQKTLLDVTIWIFNSCPSMVPTLAHEVQKLCFNPEFSDIKIICDGQEFPCHKFVLCLRSDIFKAMLENSSGSKMYKENQEGILKVDDISAETMKDFLHFMYHDNILSEKINGDLLIAADKYQFKRLLEICINDLKENINIKNVIECIYAAHLISNEGLLEACYEFMSKKRGDIKKGPIWDKIRVEHPEIATMILEKIFFAENDSDENRNDEDVSSDEFINGDEMDNDGGDDDVNNGGFGGNDPWWE